MTYREETLIPALAPSLRDDAKISPAISLEQYYSEAGPDYAAWSKEFNMHFGYFRVGVNPFRREPMLEQMNVELLERLAVAEITQPRLLDLGCGLGATLRSLAHHLPDARITGLTKVPWQVEQATQLNRAAGCGDRVQVVQGEYEDTILPRGNYHGVYALESACHAHGADKHALMQEAFRLLRPGGRLVVADGFLARDSFHGSLHQRIYRKLCECWVSRSLHSLIVS